MSESGIILIGPIGSGKSTIAALVSKKLNMPRCSMDDHRWGYYEEIGYDYRVAERLERKDGINGVYRYWKEFEIHAVERLLSEHKNSVIDFGAGHSVYEDEAYLKRAKIAMGGFKNVVLLLPSSDLKCSLKILNERNNFESENEINLNRHFLEHKSNFELAKHIVYTNGCKPEDSAFEVIRKISV
ncbi:shikimate kinase [Alcanivorax balearicus MACL04]|uniref:Shikimate kinase n=1 Tax=Alloalcanivorax balearicus MACL04 TaxID=1177182 RepID=A0ABT2QW59_9GAMM|nr:shikimate kinase [Alloalcanivorax balearicus]MCU5781752.1 shikimate kinase [Alloalcanivorax balearicus MACL04]